MKRSEMFNLIKTVAVLNKDLLNENKGYLFAQVMLETIENAGMLPPDVVLEGSQIGKYWDNQWEKEEESDTK